MHIHLAFFGSGPGSAAGTCDEQQFAAAGVAGSRPVLATPVGHALRF